MTTSSDRLRPPPSHDDKPGDWPEDANPYSGRPLAAPPEINFWRSLQFARLVLAIHAILIVSYLLGTMVYGMRCERLFSDFNLRVAAPTGFVLNVSRWLNNYGYVLVIMASPAFAVDGSILFLLHRSPRTRRWSVRWAVLVVLLLLLAAAATAFSLYMPYASLPNAVSRP